ncbi:MAG: hypothetical protein BA862_01530 [Desulfobulbaceae bacterium S3730MH12]|nr:MAG: hypothetical protein BA866_12595 [Desulfobulbaceae bacterium S5133MH15]OEU54514.1 MAG: hypothetical protein BA862_01530 [Desulfobulbaceae bacterium S3730MH12]OEU78623.1 MAG: hypothetical protein BA873_03350 [Desulfobulbaceae bacterium C00003063]
MNFNNSFQPSVSSAAQVTVGQRSQGLRIGKLPSGIILWRPVGKTLFFLLPLVLAVNLYVVSSVSKINDSIIAADNNYHELMDKNIELRAVKARVRDPEQLQKLAADKLSLFVHSKGQVGKYNPRKGYFIYL